MKDEKELNGFITLHRAILNWEWYDDVNTKVVFIHLLLMANFKNAVWHGVKIKRGELITSIKTLSQMLTISERGIRTALNHLKATNEVTIKTTRCYSLVTIVNYEKYQQKPEAPTHQPTSQVPDHRHTTDTPPTHHRQQRNNDNNDNNDNNTRERERAPIFLTGYYENVRLTEEQVEQLKKDFPKQWDTTLERLSSYIQETGKTYKDHFSVLCRWCKEDSLKAKEKVEVKRTLADRELP